MSHSWDVPVPECGLFLGGLFLDWGYCWTFKCVRWSAPWQHPASSPPAAPFFPHQHTHPPTHPHRPTHAHTAAWVDAAPHPLPLPSNREGQLRTVSRLIVIPFHPRRIAPLGLPHAFFRPRATRCSSVGVTVGSASSKGGGTGSETAGQAEHGGSVVARRGEDVGAEFGRAQDEAPLKIAPMREPALTASRRHWSSVSSRALQERS
jgi:hypothetical protein